MNEFLWLLVIVGGPVVIGGAIAFAMASRRRLSASERKARDRATDRLYHADNADS